MTDRFQINGRHQLKSFEKGLITFSLAFAGTVVGGLLGIFDLNDFVFLTTIFVLVCIGFSLPAIYLHVTYLVENWGTIVHVDKRQNSLTIKTENGDFNYKFEDIENSELNLGIYYKNELDNRGRWPAPWTNYGYIKLKLKDGKEFMLTSLIVDLNKQSLPVTTTKFRLIPSLER